MKKHNGILFFILSIFLWSFLIFKPALSQDTEAGLLPNAVQQFFDNNGNPLSSGKVYFYEVGTTTFKDTYTSSEAITTNPNPITLNAGGKAPTGGIYGIGLYRQLVKDRNGNTIWDAVTSPTGSGGSTPTEVGDGNLVGTVLPWSGLVAPNQYLFAYGQEIDRTAYPEFFTAITLQTNVICTSASNTLTGIADTTQIPIGSAIELSLCVPSGTTVVSKTTSSVTLSNPSSVSINSVARFFPFGNGDGSSTFNVPDLRGYTLAGRNNMGGLASVRLTSTYFGSNPDALAAIGGSQSHTQTIAEMATHTHVPTLTDPGHNHGVGTFNQGFTGGGPGPVGSGAAFALGTITINSNTTGISISNSTSGGSQAFSIVQPTLTINYIIKVTPDTSTSIATGVWSIGGMTGVISCGTGILCTGNFISFNGSVVAGGTTNDIQFKNTDGSFGGSSNLKFISPDNLTLGAAGVTGKFDILGSTSGRIRQQAQAVASTPTVTWGTSSGTPAVTASLPLILNSTTGDLTCPTCATSSLNGQALTRTNDTNVTLTLSGAATTALLSPASITVGWAGTLAAGRLNSNVVQSITNDTNITGSISAQNLTLGWTGLLGFSRGGTNNSLIASNGGIVWSDASKLNILAGTATANLPLLSGSTTTPSWATISYPISATSGGIPYFSSTSVMSSSGLLGANQLMIGGGAGAAPSTFSCATSTTVVHGGTPPTCSQIVSSDITTNTITNSNLSQTNSATLKGNPTASLANVQDFTLGGLTQTVSPSSLDWMLIYDNATGTFKKINAGTIASSSVAGVSSIAGNTGAFTLSTGITNSTNDIQLDKATSANLAAGTSNKAVTADIAVSSPSPAVLTAGATITPDLNTAYNFMLTPNQNFTLANPSNMSGKEGRSFCIVITNDSTPRTMSLGTVYFAPGGASTLTLTASSGAKDQLCGLIVNSTQINTTITRAYSH